MRSWTHRAAQAIAWLAGQKTGKDPDNYTGDNAKNLPEHLALRLASRMDRHRFSGQAVGLSGLIHQARQRQRARQTHPGKR